MDERPDPSLRAGPGDRRDRWLAAFDETLAGLAAQRPLSAVLGEILRHTTASLAAPHAFVCYRTTGEGPPACAALGAWANTAAAELARDAALCRELGPIASPPTAGPALAVPIRVGERTVGTLGVARAAKHAAGFGPETGEALLRVAQLIALAIENERLVDTERAARRRAEALQAATRALSSSLRLTEVLERILSELQNVVPHDTASVQQLRGERMVIVGGRGIDLDKFLGFGFPAYGGRGPNSEVLRTRGPVIVPDILGAHPYPEFPHAEHALSGVRCWLGVPLLFGDACTGMLTLDKREPDFYTAAHAQAASAFAAQAAIALENARLYETSEREVIERRRAEDELREANRRLQRQIAEVEALESRLREQAIRDPLTGLFNRRYFSETLGRELARCRREQRPLSLALLDLDHFKEVNDAHGHAAGDRMLEAFGRFLGERTRDSDIACRYGGEEFIVLLPGATGAEAFARAEQWRQAAHTVQVEIPGGALGVAVSAGVAEVPTHAETGDDLIRSADMALYQAKREGRDRVVLAR